MRWKFINEGEIVLLCMMGSTISHKQYLNPLVPGAFTEYNLRGRDCPCPLSQERN